MKAMQAMKSMKAKKAVQAMQLMKAMKTMQAMKLMKAMKTYTINASPHELMQVLMGQPGGPLPLTSEAPAHFLRTNKRVNMKR